MRLIAGVVVCHVTLAGAFAADLTPQTQRAFDRYIQLTEARLERSVNGPDFFYSNPGPEQKAKLRKGDLVTMPQKTLDNGKEIDVPGGFVQDWLGLLFIPGATVPQVRSVLQDYAAYKQIYKPEVIESKMLDHKGSDYEIFLRLYKKQFVTIVLNANYRVHFGGDSPRMYVNSRSTRIAEVKDPDRPNSEELPVGRDDGFLWALNSYWRFEEADGGVYAQLQAVSLSRDLPFGLMWLKGFLQKFPRESMEATLKGTKRAMAVKR